MTPLLSPIPLGKIIPLNLMEEGWDMKGGWFIPKGRKYPRIWYPWNGKKLFFNHYLDGGKIYHPEQAERLLSRIRGEVDAGTFDPANWGKDRTFLVKHAWKTYQDQAPCGPGRYKGRQGHFDRYIEPYFGEKSLTEIEEEHIREFRSKLPKNLAPGTIGQIMATLKAFFNSCRVTRRKVFKYPQTHLPRKQIAWLTRIDQDRVLAVIPIRHQGIFRFLMLYGCRVSEACNLRRSDIDWGKREITLRERKSGEDNTLPIMAEIEEWLVGHKGLADSRSDTCLDGMKRGSCQDSSPAVGNNSGHPTNLVSPIEEYLVGGEKTYTGGRKPSADDGTGRLKRAPEWVTGVTPPTISSMFVFTNGSIPYTRRVVGYYWGVALKKAGIAKIPLKNGTRHSKAMQLMEDDVSTAAIARVLGNTEGIVRRAYARATTKKVAEILELKRAGGE